MKMKKKFVDKGYPVVIGEYGANRKDASLFGGNQEKHNESMMAWYGAVTARNDEGRTYPIRLGYQCATSSSHDHLRQKETGGFRLYIFKGVMQGAAEGMEDYLRIYRNLRKKQKKQ